jgi:hypothetical protein
VRLHLVALPHTRVHRDHNGCAYTAKTVKFCRMMGDRHEILLYAAEGSDAPGAAEIVGCLSQAERVQTFGPDDPARLPAWPNDEQSALFNHRAGEAILDRAQPEDLVLLTGGRTHLPVWQKLQEPGPPRGRPNGKQRKPPRVVCVEPGVGYEGVFTGRCAFESYTWMHFVKGKWGHTDNTHWYDTVIPNYFDPDDFPHVNQGGGEYLMFLGRVNPDKGVGVAAQIAREVGMPLLIAGAGVTETAPGRVVGNGVTAEGDVEYYGPVTIEERAELLAGAACLLAPTMYIEPFGGVAVEAMLAGTPAVTTDLGAFTETVQPGVSGYRFSTFQEGIDAVHAAMELDPRNVRAYALGRYSLAAVGPMFDRWLERQHTSFRPDGWYARRPEPAVQEETAGQGEAVA